MYIFADKSNNIEIGKIINPRIGHNRLVVVKKVM